MGDTQELGERRTQQILMRALGAGGFVARVGEAPVCAARVRRGGDFGAPVRRSGVGLEGHMIDLCSDRCLNLSDRCSLERKKSAGVGQAFTRLCKKMGCWSCGSATYLRACEIGCSSSFPHQCENH